MPPTAEGEQRGVYTRMWSTTIHEQASDAIDAFRSGWSALQEALARTSDEMLEREYKGFGGPQPGAAFLMSLLNEVSHHGTSPRDADLCASRSLWPHERLRLPHSQYRRRSFQGPDGPWGTSAIERTMNTHPAIGDAL